MTVPYSYAPAGRTKPVSVVVGVVLAATAVLTAVGLAAAGHRLGSELASASFQSHSSLQAVGASVWHGLSWSVLNPWYWAFVILLTVLQWFWPARRDQRTLSIDMAVDAVWFVVGNALQLTVVAVVLGATTVAYSQLLGSWSLDLRPQLGLWGLAVLAFVLTDLLAWVSHWCHHKVRTLWRFHSVHHSQQRLNALSDNRTHVGEVVAAALIVFVPSQILGLNAATAMGLTFIGIYYSAMLHSNIRTDLGPLRYVFMGPQPHRVHHSVLPQHYEKNFGTVFSWWDWLAGTMYRGFDEYPPTGITDTAFPLRSPGDRNPWRWVVIFCQQLAYPFMGIVHSWLRPRGRHATGSRPRAAVVGDTQMMDVASGGSPARASGPWRRAGQNYRSPDWAPTLLWTVGATSQLYRSNVALAPSTTGADAAPVGPKVRRVGTSAEAPVVGVDVEATASTELVRV